MVRNSSGIDLEAALSFQKLYVQVICDALSACFVDNNVVDAFKILNPSNMPWRQKKLGNWGVIQLDTLFDLYCNERKIGCTIYPPLVDSIACK